MSVYNYLDYRALVRDQAQAWRKKRSGLTLQRLAEYARIQPPYLTNVLKGRAHLNSDQLYLITKALGFQSDETAYALKLLEWERCSLADRKRELEEQIHEIRRNMLKTEKQLRAKKVDIQSENFMRFYLNPDLQLVYTFLGVKRFAQNIDLIAQSLGIEKGRVESLIKELKELGFITLSEQGIEKTYPNLHLPKESPLTRAQQQMLRLRSLQQQQLLDDSLNYSFMVTFTADKETRDKIHREFLKFLKTVEGWVKDAPSEEVYQIHFDLFRWSK